MPPFVVDASLTLSWCFADETTPYSRAVLAALETTYAVVPALWPFEIANALALAERRKRITQAGDHRLPGDVATAAGSGRTARGALGVAGDNSTGPRSPADSLRCSLSGLGEAGRLSLATLDHDLQAAGLALGVPALDF